MKKILMYFIIPTFVVVQSGCSIKSNAYDKIHTIFIEEQKTLPTNPVDCYVSHKNLQKKYYGKCVNGKAEGFGKALGEGKNEYVGYFKDGKLDGDGFFYMDYADTYDTYIGKFANDKLNGKGTLYELSGSYMGRKYGNYCTGNWVDDRREGIFECMIYDIQVGKYKQYIEYKDGVKIRYISSSVYAKEQAEKRALKRQLAIVQQQNEAKRKQQVAEKLFSELFVFEKVSAKKGKSEVLTLSEEITFLSNLSEASSSMQDIKYVFRLSAKKPLEHDICKVKIAVIYSYSTNVSSNIEFVSVLSSLTPLPRQSKIYYYTFNLNRNNNFTDTIDVNIRTSPSTHIGALGINFKQKNTDMNVKIKPLEISYE